MTLTKFVIGAFALGLLCACGGGTTAAVPHSATRTTATDCVIAELKGRHTLGVRHVENSTTDGCTTNPGNPGPGGGDPGYGPGDTGNGGGSTPPPSGGKGQDPNCNQKVDNAGGANSLYTVNYVDGRGVQVGLLRPPAANGGAWNYSVTVYYYNGGPNGTYVTGSGAGTGPGKETCISAPGSGGCGSTADVAAANPKAPAIGMAWDAAVIQIWIMSVDGSTTYLYSTATSHC